MNITLIGMPAVGKSFIGKELARKLGFSFIDVDEIIESQNKQKLQVIIDRIGDEEFIKIEEKAVLNLGEIDKSVISPGGSVVYSKKAMEFLKRKSKVVFLKDELENIKNRMNDIKNRGIVGLKDKSLDELFEERNKLYEKYADFIVNVVNFNINRIVNEIIGKIGTYNIKNL